MTERDVGDSLDEILRPFREEVKASGVTDEELTALFEVGRDEVWYGRRDEHGKPVESSPRAVFDCMVFLQGTARQESPAGACLMLFERGQITLCVSEAVLSEVALVLSRPKLMQKFTRLTPETIESLIQSLRLKGELFPNVPSVVSYARDPKDEPYLNLSLAGGARYLVTRNKDFLDLKRSGIGEAKVIRKKLSTVKILDPMAFLNKWLQSERRRAKQSQ